VEERCRPTFQDDIFNYESCVFSWCRRCGLIGAKIVCITAGGQVTSAKPASFSGCAAEPPRRTMHQSINQLLVATSRHVWVTIPRPTTTTTTSSDTYSRRQTHQFYTNNNMSISHFDISADILARPAVDMFCFCFLFILLLFNDSCQNNYVKIYRTSLR